ncbi:MAG: response regulator [Chthoniobacterales bacterium]|nr:response regulator [Chthoniobacterales bacterium]
MVKEAISPAASVRPFQVLILEPDHKLGAEIVSTLQEAVPGTISAMARSVGEAQKLAVAQKPELFVLDVDAGYEAAQEFIYDLRTSHPNARAIILTATHFTAQRDPVAGLGAMHFLEKPFPRSDFMVLVEALLAPASSKKEDHFQGTLSDLHIADIIQLKCISGATSLLEFTGPRGEKARVYFENGQVRHATAPGKEGREAFNQIVDWKGGKISEVPVPAGTPHTITLDWQVLLMEAVRHLDEARETKAADKTGATKPKQAAQTIIVIDDSLMLLSFVKEILEEQHYHVVTAATAQEGLKACHNSSPGLILLDYVLPDMKGDEVCRKLVANPVTSKIPVVYMSGYGSDLQPDRSQIPNVIGSLSKPFTSESLIKAVRDYLTGGATPASASLGKKEEERARTTPAPATQLPVVTGGKIVARENQPASGEKSKPTNIPVAPLVKSNSGQTLSGPIVARESGVNVSPTTPAPAPAPAPTSSGPIVARETTAKIIGKPAAAMAPSGPIVARESASTEAAQNPAPPASDMRDAAKSKPVILAASSPSTQSAATAPRSLPNDPDKAYFCGDSSFFSLHWALQTIAREKLTGTLRTFWSQDSVELLAHNGKVLFVTTRAAKLYCDEAPVTLLNVDTGKIEAARAQQARDGCPFFLTLAKEGLILRDPGLQLVQHYGQKLFAQLWAAERVRFVFEQESLPAYARDYPPGEDDMDQWALSTLRVVQYQELGKGATVDSTCVPAYTRDGYDRVQQLRLTVAEAQFASQFNGSRSIAQISKNLRLDIKFARVTLFRFLALEIVECWPAQLAQRPEGRGRLRGIFGR